VCTLLGGPGSALVAPVHFVMGLALGILQTVEAFVPSKSATVLATASRGS
jgi:hypothetical protein